MPPKFRKPPSKTLLLTQESPPPSEEQDPSDHWRKEAQTWHRRALALQTELSEARGTASMYARTLEQTTNELASAHERIAELEKKPPARPASPKLAKVARDYRAKIKQLTAALDNETREKQVAETALAESKNQVRQLRRQLADRDARLLEAQRSLLSQESKRPPPPPPEDAFAPLARGSQSIVPPSVSSGETELTRLRVSISTLEAENARLAEVARAEALMVEEQRAVMAVLKQAVERRGQDLGGAEQIWGQVERARRQVETAKQRRTRDASIQTRDPPLDPLSAPAAPSPPPPSESKPVVIPQPPAEWPGKTLLAVADQKRQQGDASAADALERERRDLLEYAQELLATARSSQAQKEEMENEMDRLARERDHALAQLSSVRNECLAALQRADDFEAQLDAYGDGGPQGDSLPKSSGLRAQAAEAKTRQLEQLMSEHASLERRLIHAEQTKVAAERETSIARAAAAEGERRVAHRDDHIRELQGQLASMTRQLAEAKHHLSTQLEAKDREFALAMKDAGEHLSGLAAQLDASREQLSQLDQAKTQLAEKDETIQHLTETCEQHRLVMSDLGEQIALHKQHAADLQSTVADLQDKLEEQTRRYQEEKEKEKSSMERSVLDDAWQYERSQLMERIASLERQNRSIQEQNTLLQASHRVVGGARSSSPDTETIVAKLKQELARVRSELRQTQLRGQRGGQATKPSSATRQRIPAEDSLSLSTTVLGGGGREPPGLSREIQRQLDQLAQAQKDLAEFHTQVQESHRSRSRAEHQVAALKGQVHGLVQQLQGKDQRIDSLQSSLSKARQAVDEEMQRTAAAMHDKRQSERAFDELKARLDALSSVKGVGMGSESRDQVRTLTSQLAICRAECEDAKRENAALRGQLSSLRARAETAQLDAEQAFGRAAGAETALATARADLSHATARILELRGQLERLEKGKEVDRSSLA